MSDLPTPSATRLARARWLDPRLVVGILLVLLSVVVGAKVVSGADDTVAVWSATRDLGTGITLGSGDLRATRVHLSAGSDHYLAARGAAPVGYVVTRPVGRGELLPSSAVSTVRGATLRRLPVSVDSVTASGLSAGSVVDVWSVPKTQAGQSAVTSSTLVVAGVTVADVDHAATGLGATGDGGGVTLLVTPEQAKAVLDAQSAGDLALLQHAVSSSPAAAVAAGP